MMMKKLVAGALATLTMVAPMATPIYAVEGTTDPTTATTDVKYLVEDGYTWQIHDVIDFGKNAGVSTTVDKTGNVVEVTKNVIQEGKKLNIKVEGSGTDKAFTITNGGSEVLTYHINDGTNEIATGGDVLNVNSGTNTGSTTLKFTLDTAKKASEVAGQYNGTVTYTASIINQ